MRVGGLTNLKTTVEVSNRLSAHPPADQSTHDRSLGSLLPFSQKLRGLKKGRHPTKVKFIINFKCLHTQAHKALIIKKHSTVDKCIGDHLPSKTRSAALFSYWNDLPY